MDYADDLTADWPCLLQYEQRIDYTPIVNGGRLSACVGSSTPEVCGITALGEKKYWWDIRVYYEGGHVQKTCSYSLIITINHMFCECEGDPEDGPFETFQTLQGTMTYSAMTSPDWDFEYRFCRGPGEELPCWNLVQPPPSP
jgi:hypothetical protein